MARLANDFSWSVSRAQLFEQCQRAYYFQYYGSWGGWERGTDAATRKLYILKNIKTLPMWAGTIVHETIAESLSRFARTGHQITTGELQARGRQSLRQGWVDAVNGEWRTTPKKTNLYELYYGNGKSLPAETTEDTKTRVYDCLRAFAESDILADLIAIPYMNWKPIDTLDSVSLDGLKVWVAVDFAYTTNDNVCHILDWKTGGENRDALQNQLACYAFYANSVWHIPIEAIRLHGVFLREHARVSDYEVRPDLLVEARNFILESAARMREKLIDVPGNVAQEDDFPCCTNPRSCARCNFREACPCPASE